MKNGGKLLQVLACQMNCTYLSDLRFLSGRRREELAEKVKNLSSDVAYLEEWNDALLYLTGCGPEETVKEAQRRLAEQLRAPEED